MKATEFDKRIGLSLAMILLDSDHLSMLKYSNTPTFSRLAGRMADSVDQDALMLTANTKDFEKVPGLRIDNWRR